MSKTQKTVEEELVALKEKREKVHRQIVKARLSSNKRFQAMADSFKKVNRYRTEAESLVDDTKYEEKRAAIQARLDDLESRRALAVEAAANLTALHETHVAAQNTLATALIQMLDTGDIPDDFDSRVDSLLDSIDADTLGKEPDDPFVAYRRTKSDK